MQIYFPFSITYKIKASTLVSHKGVFMLSFFYDTFDLYAFVLYKNIFKKKKKKGLVLYSNMLCLILNQHISIYLKELNLF